MVNFDLTGKVAVVTGGGVGLGRGMVLALAGAGADIVLVSNVEVKETIQEVETLGRKVLFLQADLSKKEEIDRVIKCSIDTFGHVDILVNNAGIIKRTPYADHPAEDWQAVIDLNLNSVFYLSQGFGRHMIERGSGKIINIASMLSFQGGINVPGYTASKHAVAGLTKAMANEWASKGVQVNAIAPGYMATANTQQIRADQERYDSITVRIPADRWGTPEDLQGPVVFLASEASNYVNGHILCVDGGWMVR